ncbi:MAG: 50S ribosomal protein L6 [bacterium]
MSRIGKKPITIPAGVTVEIKISKKSYNITVKGPKGELVKSLPVFGVSISQQENEIIVSTKSDDTDSKAKWGLYRSLVANMVTGVSEGIIKELEMKGVGYKAEMKGANLSIAAGYSHPVVVVPESGISFEVANNVNIKISGIDKEHVGNVAAKIRAIRPPEPYKGKGIRYKDEVVRRKATKSLKK